MPTVQATSTTNDAANLDDVVRRAQQGDVAAFETIYHSHAPAILALCRRMASDEREARELVQDAFIRAWERLATFRGQSSLATWLHRLAVNVVLNHLRVVKRDMRLVADDETVGALVAREQQTTARMDIETALARLPTGARTVIVLHDIHGYSHDEIAQMTGIAAGTSRAQLWRARRALMQTLDP